MKIKTQKSIVCDICGKEIGWTESYPKRSGVGSTRYAIRGKKYVLKIFFSPDADYLEEVSRRFDMCGKCMEEFRKFVKEKRERD